MSPTAFVKALLLNAAATNAAAVCQNTAGGGPPVDPLIQDAGLRDKGVMVYEECKIQYAALVRAFEDKTGIWPDPKVAEVSSPATPGFDLGAVSALVAQILPQVIALFGKQAAAAK